MMENMVEELTEQVIDTTAEDYWKSGGKLDRDCFEYARDIQSGLEKGGVPRGMKNSSLLQAEHMAQFSKVPITQVQKYLYAVLRDMTEETGGMSDSPPETPETLPAWSLTDQRLLAEVIRLTDETKLDSFTNAYPNIFEITE
jgi:hypothetical protein